MWYQYARNKKLFEVRLGDELPEKLELIAIKFDSEDVLFSFGIRGVPVSVYKWDVEGVNSVLLNIKMVGVSYFDYIGSFGDEVVSPKINTYKDYAEISINHPWLIVSCVSKELRVESVDAYIDERWD